MLAKRNMLVHEEDNLLTALLDNQEFGFKKKEVADFMGITASTVSKKLSKIRGMEKEDHHAQ